MAVAEKLQWVVSANADSAINAFKKTGQAAEKELGGAEKRLDKVGAGMTKMGAGAMAAAGVVAVGLWKIGSGASDLAESINAVNVTFGEAAEGVLELGENAAKSVGLSRREFGMLAVQFSAFADKIAGSGGDVVSTLDEMTTRAADFASVMNIDVAEAARIFQSALAGEQEPIKKFGIDLSAAAVEAYAYANSITKAGAELSATEKVQARYGLLLEQTNKMSGDFANTSDGVANSQRILKADLQNLSDTIGSGLLPIMTTVVGALSDVFGLFSSLPEPVQKTLGAVAGFSTIAIGAGGALSFVVGKLITARENFSKMGGAATKASLAMGAVGIVLGIGAAIYGNYQDKKAEAVAITDDFVTALRAEAEGQNDATRAAIAAQLADKDLVASAKEYGLTVAQLADVITGKVVPAYEDLADDNRDGGFFSLTGEISDSTIAADEFINKMETMKESMAAAKDEIKLADAVNRELGVGFIEVAADAEHTAKSADELAEEVEAVEEAEQAAADAAEELADAAEELANELQDLREEALTLASSMWDVEAGTINANKAYAEYKLSLVDGETTMEDLRLAQISQVQGLAQLAEATVTATGVQADSEAGVHAQITALQTLQTQFPLLRDEIQKYINKLMAIPRNVTTTVGTTGSGSTATVGNVAWKADGAIVHSPTIVGVGDAPGGEAVLNKPQVQDLVEWAGLNSPSRPGGGGGSQTVIVNALTADPRLIVEAIKQYQRRGGVL